MSARRENCKFEHCDNAVHYPILQVCSTCYSGLRLWAGRSSSRQRVRLRQYERMQDRMSYLMDGRGLLPGYSRTKAGKLLRAERARRGGSK